LERIADFTKNLFLDAFASVRGFIYGFSIICLVIALIVLSIYLVATIINLIR